MYGIADHAQKECAGKATKNKVLLQWGGCELLDHYYPMVQELSRKTGITMQPKSYYHSVLSRFSPHDEAGLYLIQHKGKYLSGGIFLRFGKKGYYWHGAAYIHGKRLGHIINRLYRSMHYLTHPSDVSRYLYVAFRYN
jgi:hypothetical protein